MKIIHQSTILRTICESDIEQIRQWRNADRVNQYLVNRKPISREEQIRWFQGIDPTTSIYFMIDESNISLGTIYVHGIDLEQKSFWGNIFIGNPHFSNSPLVIKSVLLLTIFFFEHLDFDKIYSIMHYKNSAAVEMNKRLGFVEMKRENNFITGICHKNDFELRTKNIRKALLRNIPMKIEVGNEDDKYTFLKSITSQHT